jgi:gp16 family phage-associated protein
MSQKRHYLYVSFETFQKFFDGGAMPKPNKLTPIEHRKAQFDAHGITIAAWARDRGFDPLAVVQVLNGYTRGKRGKSREIAIALGLRTADHSDAA